jgi:hypothetical protein
MSVRRTETAHDIIPRRGVVEAEGAAERQATFASASGEPIRVEDMDPAPGHVDQPVGLEPLQDEIHGASLEAEPARKFLLGQPDLRAAKQIGGRREPSRQPLLGDMHRIADADVNRVAHFCKTKELQLVRDRGQPACGAHKVWYRNLPSVPVSEADKTYRRARVSKRSHGSQRIGPSDQRAFDFMSAL